MRLWACVGTESTQSLESLTKGSIGVAALAHIVTQLSELASMCSMENLEGVNGWAVDRWTLAPPAVDKLVETYSQLIYPVEAEIEDALTADGIDIRALLADEDAASDVITRSDMTELAVAASVLASESADPEHMLLPNVPKGGRGESASGIDVLAASVRQGKERGPLDDDEWLLIASVKHTIADGADMGRKLAASMRLTLPYLTAQVRVLHGRLQERGIALDRLYLVLNDFPDGPHIRLFVAGCADPPLAEKFLTSLAAFPHATSSSGHVRCIVIDALGELHERFHS